MIIITIITIAINIVIVIIIIIIIIIIIKCIAFMKTRRKGKDWSMKDESWKSNKSPLRH